MIGPDEAVRDAKTGEEGAMSVSVEFSGRRLLAAA
jgi:hypothetical protein